MLVVKNGRFTISYLKCVLSFCVIIFASQSGFANIIDSLVTKQDIKRFLDSTLGKTGVVYLGSCADISRAERIRMYFSQPDTVGYEDPTTGEISLKTVPRERQFKPNDFCYTDTPYPLNYSINEVLKAVDSNYWRCYKVDIDNNGRTDLVLAPSIVVMDKGDNNFEGHMFTYPDMDSNIFSLEKVISLPNNSEAILFRNTFCNLNTAGKVTHKIDTIIYKYNGFVKYNSHFKPADISKVYYHYGFFDQRDCDGFSCIEIYNNGKCFLRYSDYDTVFSAVLEKSRLDALWDLISYVDVPSKADDYIVKKNTGSYGVIVVHFSDQSVKSVRIWGCPPPMGLNYITKNISDISRVLTWHLSEEYSDFVCPYISPKIGSENNNCCDW